jgi:large subunit ribosomal protein L28
MSRKCVITGKKPLSGNNVSHAHNKTRRAQLPNIQNKRIFVPELDRFVRLRVSTRALRSISKLGLMNYLKKNKLTLNQVLG